MLAAGALNSSTTAATIGSPPFAAHRSDAKSSGRGCARRSRAASAKPKAGEAVIEPRYRAIASSQTPGQARNSCVGGTPASSRPDRAEQHGNRPMS